MRFRDVLGRWKDTSDARLVDGYDLAEGDPPYALLERAHAATLVAICRELPAAGRLLPEHIAGLTIAFAPSLEGISARRTLHRRDVTRADTITLRDGIATAHSFWGWSLAVARFQRWSP